MPNSHADATKLDSFIASRSRCGLRISYAERVLRAQLLQRQRHSRDIQPSRRLEKPRVSPPPSYVMHFEIPFLGSMSLQAALLSGSTDGSYGSRRKSASPVRHSKPLTASQYLLPHKYLTPGATGSSSGGQSPGTATHDADPVLTGSTELPLPRGLPRWRPRRLQTWRPTWLRGRRTPWLLRYRQRRCSWQDKGQNDDW